MKGLPRSLSRANAAKNAAVRRTISLSGTVNVEPGGVGEAGFGSLVVGGFPEGNILLLGAVANVRLDGSDNDNLAVDWEGDFAIGSAATANSVLEGSEVDVIPSTAVDEATGKVSPITRGANETPVILDNTDGLNLNVLIDDGGITDDEDVDLTVTGELYLCYTVLGDD